MGPKDTEKDSLISERKIIFFLANGWKGSVFWYKVLINLIGRIKYSKLYLPFQQYSVTAQLVPLCDLSPWRHLTTAFQAFKHCVDLTIYNDYCRVRLAVVSKNLRKIPESLSSGGAGTLHSPLFRAQVYQSPARLDI